MGKCTPPSVLALWPAGGHLVWPPGAPGSSGCLVAQCNCSFWGCRGKCDNQTHTLEGGQCRGDRAVSTPLAQSLEQEHPCSLIPVSPSVSHHLSLAYPCLTLDFHLKAAEGKRDMDFLRFCFLAFNGEPGQRVLSN